LVVFHKYS